MSAGSGDGAAGGGRRSAAGSPPAEPGPVHPVSRVRPERRAVESLTPFDGDEGRGAIERLRKLGYTVASAAPTSGLLRGNSVVFLLAEDRPVAEIVLRADGVAHAALERGRFGQGYPTSLMGAAAALRQAFHDARRYDSWSRRYAADPSGMRRPDRHDAFAALLPVMSRERRVFWEVDSPLDALLAHDIAAEFELDVAIRASGHEWERAEAIAATGRTLILPLAFPDKPKVQEEDEALAVSRRTLRRWVEAPGGPGRLHEAGVRFAFTTDGLDTSSDAPKNLRAMIEAGLPEETALAALTTVPAQLLGVERVVGTLAPGKIANVVIATGPPFAEESQIREVFVDGRRHEIEIKQKPKGDPDAVVDPRGTWTVAIDFGGRTVERRWTIEGEKDRYRGTAETGRGDVDFESIELAGNVMTVRLPGRPGGDSLEITVVVEGDTFAGDAEMGSRTIEVKGSRQSGPGGGER